MVCSQPAPTPPPWATAKPESSGRIEHGAIMPRMSRSKLVLAVLVLASGLTSRVAWKELAHVGLGRWMFGG